MSAHSLEVLAIQAEQIRSQVEQLRAHLHAHSYESSLLTGTAVLMGQVVAGLRLEADPVLRAETKARLNRDAAERRNRAAEAHVERRCGNCFWWMTRKCPREMRDPTSGSSAGSPTTGSPACELFATKEEVVAEHRAAVAADGRA